MNYDNFKEKMAKISSAESSANWENEKQNLVAKMATLQSISEIGVGSIAYTLHIPFTGHLMSLNQNAILTWTAKLSPNRRESISTCTAVASIASLLKSLSPAGKKLTPMLAISIQGFLYSLGISIFGRNILGLLVGSALACSWGFIQPVLFAIMIFGQPLVSGIEKIWKDVSETFNLSSQVILWVLIVFILLKIIFGLLITAFVWLSPITMLNKYQNYIGNLDRKTPNAIGNKTHRPAWQQAFYDMLTPWFILSMILSSFFLFFAQHEMGSNIWLYLLRPIALGWLGFWFLRSVPDSWFLKLEKRFPAFEKTRKMFHREK